MEILNSIKNLLVSWGMAPGTADALDHFIAFTVLVLIALAADQVCRRVVLKAVAQLVKKTKATWDDVVFDHKVMVRLSHIVVPLIIYLFIPVAFADTNAATVDIIQRICMVLIILSLLFFAHAFMGAVYSVYSATGRYRNRPLKGMVQTVQVALWLVGIIVIIGQLTGQEVLSLLGGLGAMSAVLMLVFKDTIMGFVSGVQLSANNMLKVGDWIKMPKYGVDGTVTEVSLTTVKVRNWDNTVATLPPYMLVSEMFENWNAMRESGGRRVKRSINIDMNSVCFCTPEMLEEYRKIDLLKEYMSQEHEDPLTNLGVFRAYLVAWLRNRPVVNTDLHCMVRQLQPTEYGIPLELYFFSRIKDWVPYEGVQSDVFDYVLAVVPRFGLRVFQLPSGEDLQMLIGKKSQ
ncbi:MAG TPA: mechanosensitive ion channel family protein [Candidatus Bacteroides avicola]|uniref:Mechanosensitive ion channel family protein n=1 Tax=Candidatus Bacteroides avicola TaxID=2838468 RepID=A0A9D2HY09_9BACE|nr:mechanosensitive ion channel domain-containing protein [Mediterranea sp. An20]MBW9202950.1 mechanosensitive ion channel [Bacteroidales bacterium SW292]OUP09617.1 hypothetical protein B5F34_06050 [Mediterranea sp. An20]HJA87030.1 mechanosensitive ion channel family protein [Candidatus Bacteroides avicola]